MNLKLVEFESTDNLTLPGLLYEPNNTTKKAAIWLHGCGSTSVFYSVEKFNTLGKILTDNNITFLPFNNRGAHIIKKLNRNRNTEQEERLSMGTSFELIKDSIYDIDGAINYLKNLGYEEFYLIGHSTGVNKICVYDYYKKDNLISKYILIGGGDDTGIYYQMLGKKTFNLALKKCKEEINKGNGDKLVPKYILDYIYSYQALYDIINPDGDYNTFPYTEYFEKLNLTKKKKLFSEFTEIEKPSLVIYGGLEEYVYKSPEEAIELLKKESSNAKNFDYKIIPDADHSITGKYAELGEVMIDWL